MGFHFPHAHARTKAHKTLKYPGLITKLVLFMAIAQPISTLPQLEQIWVQKQTEGVSFATWAFYEIAAVVWLAYGLKIHDRPLILTSTLWVVVQGLVVIGLIIY